MNDNLIPGGRLNGDTLTLDLVAAEGMWYPGGEDRPGAAMFAMGEAGGPLQVPGPLLRARVGTEVVATIRNMMPGPDLYFEGFQSRADDNIRSLLIPYGETRSISFTLDRSGIFYYWGSPTERGLSTRRGADSLLSGVIVVDPADAEIEGRFFVLQEGSSVPGMREHGINGRSFPNTEHMTVRTGETNTWHFINTSFAGHPLHLHGTFYRVTHRGDLLSYRMHDEASMLEEVTAEIEVGEVLSMQWHTERVGQWLFHCHIAAHVAADSRRLSSGPDFEERHHGPGAHEMAGMVLGITAEDRSGVEPVSAPPTRNLTMRLQPLDNYFGDNAGYATAFNEAGLAVNPPVAPGPLLVLQQDEAVGIELVNELPVATAIHWHGMELESYYDGVAGFSGTIGSVTPAVAAGGSFLVRMTPPRAGTYIYHTHMDDVTQLTRGLYGALIVQSPEYPFDPAIDKVFVIGLAGDAVRTAARAEGAVINGSRTVVMNLQGLQDYRLRLINITANNSEFEVRLQGAASAQQWTLISKDGAMIPRHLRSPASAERLPISVGETYDFAWTPPAPGVYWLEVTRADGEWMAQARLDVLAQ